MYGFCMTQHLTTLDASRNSPPESGLTYLRNSPDAALPVAEVASKVFHVDPRTVNRAIADGTIPAVRLGRRVFVPRLPLLEMLDGAGRAEPPAALPSADRRAADWVHGYLSARGLAPEAQVLADADAAGIAPSDAHRAAESLGVPRQVTAGRGVCWSLPPATVAG